MEKQGKNYRKYLIPLGMLIVGLLIGWVVFSSTEEPIITSENNHIVTSDEVWTCSMHPQIRQSEPGSCPICGMALIPIGNDNAGGDPLDLRMSETAMQLANIQTTIVGSGNSIKEIRLNGKVQADERKKSSQAAHIPGRIEQLLVNFTGEYVQKGQTIAQIYSPDLVTAQQELFETNKIKSTQPELYLAAREKLKNWRLTDKQIDAMITSGKSQERFPLLADVSGIVTERRVSVGDYVMRGAPLYDVVDLSSVWVLFDVYESDIQWVKKNSEIEFTVQSLPGETFKKRISFIDPIIDPATRVATARVEMVNPGMRLKPEMFASAIVKSDQRKGTEIIVPKTAVMWTGTRSVIYLKSTDETGVSFRMKEVTLGPSLGDSYVIKEGLIVGQEIVTNGTFTVDAAAQLAGKPSMMSPGGGAVMTGHNHGAMEPSVSTNAGAKTTIDQQAKAALKPLYDSYFELKNALTTDDFTKSQKAAIAIKNSLSKINMTLFKGETHNEWMKHSGNLEKELQHVEHISSIEDLRKTFQSLSITLISLTKSFIPLNQAVFVQH
ncbi:MAG: efflux RND transporter periplasmic adaptor subunit, partial [Bacteroidia bacterium]|nr:efflux RND transporter periplasmic adaptor subunit [Bacteroidia bacterium]